MRRVPISRGRVLFAAVGLALCLGIGVAAAIWAAAQGVPAASAVAQPFPALIADPSLDSAFPALPLPVGARLVHAGMLGEGRSAIRQASWLATQSFDEVTRFYHDLAAAGWTLAADVDGATETRFAVEQAAGSPATGSLRVSRRSTTTEIVLTIGGRVPPVSLPPGFPAPQFPVGQKPGVTKLPSDFPTELIFPDSNVLDSAPGGAAPAARFASGATLDDIEAFYLAAFDRLGVTPTVERHDGGVALLGRVHDIEYEIVVGEVGGATEIGVMRLP